MRIAIVTGASSGMGRDFVRALDGRGLDEIWAVARRLDALGSLAAECRTRVRPLSLDLKTDGAFETLSSLLRETSPEVQYLICGAGYGRFGDYTKVGTEESLGMIELNITALVRTTYLVLPFMPQGSHIIGIASASAFVPLPHFNIYASTKAFVRHFLRALGPELSGRGITVTALCPGWVDTHFMATADKTSTDSVTSFPFMKKSPEVVDAALKAADRGRHTCVPGVMMKAMHLFSGLLPSSVSMKVWEAVRK